MISIIIIIIVVVVVLVLFIIIIKARVCLTLHTHLCYRSLTLFGENLPAVIVQSSDELVGADGITKLAGATFNLKLPAGIQ